MLSRSGFVHDLVRAVSWHRRLLAAGLAAAGVAVALHVLQPQEAPTTAILAAAHDLRGGTTLAASDVRTVALPHDLIPAGALTERDGVGDRVLAGPVRAGEPLTNVRFLGPGLLPPRAPCREGQTAPLRRCPTDSAGSLGELVAVPVRLADAGAHALVRVGDRIDLLAAETDAATAYAPARTVARAVRVLALPVEGSPALGLGSGSGAGADALTSDGGLVVVAVTPVVAADLARAAVTARLSLVLRGA